MQFNLYYTHTIKIANFELPSQVSMNTSTRNQCFPPSLPVPSLIMHFCYIIGGLIDSLHGLLIKLTSFALNMHSALAVQYTHWLNYLHLEVIKRERSQDADQ